MTDDLATQTVYVTETGVFHTQIGCAGSVNNPMELQDAAEEHDPCNGCVTDEYRPVIENAAD